MILCNECGNPTVDGEAFCSECGAAIALVTDTAGQRAPKVQNATVGQPNGKSPGSLADGLQKPADTTIPDGKEPTVTAASMARAWRNNQKAVVVFIAIFAVIATGIVVYFFLYSRTQSSSSASGLTSPKSEIKNTYGIELVWIPPGTFMMGAENEGAEEMPVHKVTISRGFYIGKYEITQAEWEAVMRNNPSEFKGERRPVAGINWNDAQAFIARLNAIDDGYNYRLPTEAEWEYACRAGSTGDAGSLEAMAWYSKNSGSQSHNVGTKQPNAWGLYDMHGNVLEWCEDRYRENYNGAPINGSAWETGGAADYRVVRGGSWNSDSQYVTSAYRYGTYGQGSAIGFRLVCVERSH